MSPLTNPISIEAARLLEALERTRKRPLFFLLEPCNTRSMSYRLAP
jgi:hypothetical protein